MSEIKANTCPYCNAPYGIQHAGCRDRCAGMAEHQRLVQEAIDIGERLAALDFYAGEEL